MSRSARLSVVSSLLIGTLGIGCSGQLGSSNDDAAQELSSSVGFLGTSSAVLGSAGGTSLSINAPAGTQAGDLMLAAIGLGESTNASLPTFTAPAGWTLIRRIDQGTASSLAIYRHIATTNEPTSYGWTSSLLVHGVAWISSYSGVDSANPIDVEAGGMSNTAGTSFSTPSITTTGANDLLVATFSAYGSAGANWSAPGGFTSRENLNNGAVRSGLGSDATQAAAGPSGVKTANVSSTQSYALTELLALRPAISGSGTITRVGTSTTILDSNGGKGVTLSLPAGTASGQLLVAGLALGESSNTSLPAFTAPAGWTLIRRVDQGTVASLAVYTHVVGSSEPASYSWSSSLVVHGVTWMSAYSGVDGVHPVDTEAGQALGLAGSIYSTPSITTSGPGELLVTSFAGYGSQPSTWTAPTGFAVRVNLNNGSVRSGLSADATQSMAGASGAKTATASSAQSYSLVEVLALRPASGSSADAGIFSQDAGSTVDAGVPPPVDAGSVTPVDAGIPPPADAGTLPTPTFFVDTNNGTANDSNAGTQASPWKTIQKAANTLTAGQTVLIKAGTYSGNVSVAHSGSPGAWITFEAAAGAVLSGAGFSINGRSYVQLDGLSIQNVNGGGINVNGPGQYIAVTHNSIFNATGSCIGAWGFPGATSPPACGFQCLQHITINYNSLDTCNNGGWNEALDIAQGVDQFEVRGNLIKGIGNGQNGGEGIDCKEGSSNGLITQNTIQKLSRDKGIYIDGGGFWSANPTPRTHDLVITGNFLVNENILMDSEHNGSIDHVTISNNVVIGTPEDGIIIYRYPNSNGGMDNVNIVNNTTYGDGTAGGFYGISLNNSLATNIVMRNNIAFGNVGAGQMNCSQATCDHNLTTDPHWVNSAAEDFHVQSNSPAIGAGSSLGAPTVDFDGVLRSATPTLGAYER